jgi:hypothetical protein
MMLTELLMHLLNIKNTSVNSGPRELNIILLLELKEKKLKLAPSIMVLENSLELQSSRILTPLLIIGMKT